MLEGYDNVVISPGPGTPERGSGFGICSEVIADATIPVLGICFGHQGLAYVHGGQVVYAPEPVHGRLSKVEHFGDALFRDIPPCFNVVRYHSLAVAGLPPQLRITALTQDGVIMGLKHAELPQWSAQFHPESISSEFGTQLLKNFRDITIAARGIRLSMADSQRSPDGCSSSGWPSPASLSKSEYTLHVRTLPLEGTSVSLFENAFGDESHAVWLDGNQVGQSSSRFSIMGTPNGPMARVITASVDTGEITIESREGTQTVVRAELFRWLDEETRRHQIDGPELPFEFSLGWVGYLGYELKAEVGAPNEYVSDLPDFVMFFLDRAIVVDHEMSEAYLLALSDGSGSHAEAFHWFDEQEANVKRGGLSGEAIWTTPNFKLHARHSKDHYLGLIEECKRQIFEGESYEICLANVLTAEVELEHLPSYLKLRESNPTPFGAFFRFGNNSILSTSPERFLKISSSGDVESKPIKGTRPRGGSPDEDEMIIRDLRSSEKDRSENLMIVDLVRHDLGRTAELGSVNVPKLFDVETYATVHQMVSTVISKLRPDASPVSCVRAAFPLVQ